MDSDETIADHTGAPTLGGQEGQLHPLPSSMGAGGLRIALPTEFFPFLLSSEVAFSGTVDSLVQENISGGKPPYPQIPSVLLGDQCARHCSSEKELEDQSLPLWRNMHIHRCALKVSLAPSALSTCRHPYGYTGGFRGCNTPNTFPPFSKSCNIFVLSSMFSYNSVNSAIFLYNLINSAVVLTQWRPDREIGLRGHLVKHCEGAPEKEKERRS